MLGSMRLFFIHLLAHALQVSARMLRSPYALHNASCSGTSLYNLLPQKFEPSDLVWDPETQRLFIVSDSGKLAALSNVGSEHGPVQIWDFEEEYDLEGCTLVPGRQGFIYLGVEYPAAILEFWLGSDNKRESEPKITRRFPLQSFFDVDADNVEVDTNAGLESISFLPSSNSTWGGFFYIGRQADARVFVFEIPLYSGDQVDVKPIGWLQPPGPGYDLSAMVTWGGLMWFLYDKPKALLAVSTDNLLPPETLNMQLDATSLQQPLIGTMKFTVRGQEGLAFVKEHNGKQWVFVGVDPPKRKGSKDLVRYELSTFFHCFARSGMWSVPAYDSWQYEI